MLKKCSSLHFFVFPARFQSKRLSETEIYPPPVRSLQWSTFLFSESFMFAAPPEACQDSYIRHLQRGSLCPSHVTGEHAEVMHIDRARSDLTQKPNETAGLSFASLKMSFFRGQDAERIPISAAVDGPGEVG